VSTGRVGDLPQGQGPLFFAHPIRVTQRHPEDSTGQLRSGSLAGQAQERSEET